MQEKYVKVAIKRNAKIYLKKLRFLLRLLFLEFLYTPEYLFNLSTLTELLLSKRNPPKTEY